MSTEPRLLDTDLPALYATYYPRRSLTAADARLAAGASAIATRAGRLRTKLRGQWTAHYEAGAGMRVLDYGCGDCSSLLELAALGADAYGFEVDPNVVPLARELGLRVHVGDLATLPQPDGFFDAITLSQVIEHAPDPEGLLQKLAVKLKPGGLLILTTPNSGSLSRRLCGRRWLHWHVPYHLNHFNAGVLRPLLGRLGFSVVSTRTFTPVPWWEYQVEILLTPPEEGKPHPYFREGRSAIRSTATGRALLRAGRVLALFATHGLDVFRLGDSLLVIARKSP